MPVKIAFFMNLFDTNIKLVLAVLFIAAVPASLGSEVYTLRTWYPSPYGSFKKFKITDTLFAGTDTSPLKISGNVEIISGKARMPLGTADSDSGDTLVTKDYLTANKAYMTHFIASPEGCSITDGSANKALYQKYIPVKYKGKTVSVDDAFCYVTMWDDDVTTQEHPYPECAAFTGETVKNSVSAYGAAAIKVEGGVNPNIWYYKVPVDCNSAGCMIGCTRITYGSK